MKNIKDISEFKEPSNKLLAPNGKASNLSPELYSKVRTAEFKRWFGDWEKDPENSSKVVDENGEPMVVYHGTPSHGFTEFLNTYDLPRATANETNNIGMWFVSEKGTAERFMFGSAKGGVYEVFLNIRNPKVFKPQILNRFEIDRLEDLYQELERKKNRIGLGKLSDMTQQERADYAKYDKQSSKVRKQINLLKSVDSFEQFMNHRDKYAEYIDDVKGELGHWMRKMINTNKNEANKKLVQEFRQDQHDGIIIASTQYDAPEDGTVNQYVVFDSNNIKAVDNTQFNPKSANIHESEMIYKGMINESHTDRIMIGDLDKADQIKKMFAEMIADKFDIDSPVRIREISSWLNDIAFDIRTYTVEDKGEAITAIAKMAETSEKDMAAAIERLLNSYDYLIESETKAILTDLEANNVVDTSIGTVKLAETNRPQVYLPKGYFVATKDFGISPGGGWQIRFKAGQIIYSDGAGKVESTSNAMIVKNAKEYNPFVFMQRKPPIHGETELKLTSYASHPQQISMYNTFVNSVKSITGKEALKMITDVINKFGGLSESIKNEDAVKAAKSNVEKRRIMDFKTFVKADENANSVEKTEHDIVKKSYSGEKKDKKGYATLSESELMGGQPNSKPMPSGYSLVSDNGDEITVQDEDGKKEVWVKNNGVASYRLLHKGNEYEFAHSVDESLSVSPAVKKAGINNLAKITDIDDFMTEFSEMYGSAAEMWMSEADKKKLQKMFKTGQYVFKVVGGEADNGRKDPKVQGLIKKGWKVFADEQNYENYDCILYMKMSIPQK